MKNFSTEGATGEEGPVFVVGMNGSGTTMLADSLGMHPDIFMFPNEVRILPYLARNQERWGDLGKLENRRRLARVLCDSRPFWLANGRKSFILPDSYLSEPGFAATITGAVRFFADRTGTQKRLWGEKSPMNVSHMDTLGVIFPNARFIHIVRDARDTAQSFHRRFGFVPAETVFRWKILTARAHAHMQVLGSSRYFELRYEDLTADPEHWMRSVCDFAGLPFDPVVLQSSMRMAAPDLAAGESRIQLNTGKWLGYFSSAEIKRLESIAGLQMQAMGYSVGIAGDDHPSPLRRMGWRAMSIVRRTWIHFRRWGWKGTVGYIKNAAVSAKQSQSNR